MVWVYCFSKIPTRTDGVKCRKHKAFIRTFEKNKKKKKLFGWESIPVPAESQADVLLLDPPAHVTKLSAKNNSETSRTKAQESRRRTYFSRPFLLYMNVLLQNNKKRKFETVF